MCHVLRLERLLRVGRSGAGAELLGWGFAIRIGNELLEEIELDRKESALCLSRGQRLSRKVLAFSALTKRVLARRMHRWQPPTIFTQRTN